MWISEKFKSFLELNIDQVKRDREALAAVTAERDLLKIQVATNTVMTDWLRTRVNTLEMEKSALLAKAFDVRIPAPELVKAVPERGFNLKDLFAGPPIEDYDELDTNE